MRDQYIEYALAKYIHSGEFDELFSTGWMTESDFREKIARISQNAFKYHGVDFGGRYQDLANDIIGKVVEANGFYFDGDDYAGRWVHFDQSKKDEITLDILNNNEVATRIERLGSQALLRALSRIAEEDSGLPVSPSVDDALRTSVDENIEEIPASDRVVRIDHNQILEVENDLQGIIDDLQFENGIDGEEGLRELVLGKLRAGKELLRAGVFTAQSIYYTLLVGLRMLVEKYQDHAIGAAAGSLLDLVVEMIKGS